ncbi:DUF3343 domain-containing protein [Clostridium ljungdahlii]|uniref:Putative Se/S carrier protein-like domain-containing protein n=1 Tax=Clostridium ljungdahlii TaxID=1538 RepID=A0A168MMQ7_9CLOT|nr:DUF3343 domain-containing protein [Clostridium ljungdahlii]OAA84910.1 hypothetical protein WY13_02813 [Clostridium ljungdahlii]
MGNKRYYILFPSHTEGMKMEKLLKGSKLEYTIVPTPREISSCCGISIMYSKKDEEEIKLMARQHNVKTLGFHCVDKKIVNPYL